MPRAGQLSGSRRFTAPSKATMVFWWLVCLLSIATIATKIITPSQYLKDSIGCISHHEANHLLSLQRSKPHPTSIEYSITLGKSTKTIYLNDDGILIDKTNLIATWDELKSIAKKTTCFALYADGSKPWQISTISQNTDIPASLSPPLEATGAPTLILGGFTMHRIAGDNINPTVDTAAKLSSIRINPGNRVLDTCMGLGYTAIGAAQAVRPNGQVVTIEYDKVSLEVSSYNPWSQGLFDGTLPIEIHEGDACEIIKTFDTGSFSCILHDPPARALCRTDLYGLAFYKELHRVLRRGGQLFHYIGSPDSKESGRLYSGITSRLIQAGFSNVKKATKAFGLVAIADVVSASPTAGGGEGFE